MARLTAVFRAHEALSNLLIGLIDDLNFDVVMQSEDAVKRTSKMVKDLVAVQITGLRNALEVAAQTHLVTSLLSEAAVAKDAAALVPMQDRFKAATDLLAKAAKTLTNEEIKGAVDELTVVRRGRQQPVRAARAPSSPRSRAPTRPSRRTSPSSARSTARSRVLVGDAEKSMQRGSVKLVEDLGRNRMLLMIVAAVSLLVAGAIGVFYVQRRLVRRLTSVGDAMRRLSSGDTDIDGAGRGRPRRDRRDGALARSVPRRRDRAARDGGAPGGRAGGAARPRAAASSR